MPAPPPPPPSLPKDLCHEEKVENGNDLPLWTTVNSISDESEIEKLIAKNKLQDAEIIYFHRVKPILQKGPQCGLVALAMAAEKSTNPVLVNQLLTEAKIRGFTQHGEIYSVDFMKTLATEHIPNHESEILVNLQDCPNTIPRTLACKAMILITYDSDFNHAPCLKRGHRAHWALLVGYISSRQGYYVLARHGKSRYLACWPLCDLLESNANLEEEGEARHAGGYVIPQGGVGGERGLKGRALALHPCN